ncbi:hypothetical protein INT43_004414 [Umbelopsis isabellina]|uniref:Major facilitator superfamily (MFS) profile domain-containing protein n=1 Tax=Mortierella isabellina TaxID=91625 RepID=A0A8H7PJF9_MORIS|nr:hypothetical protein INT43_004414 [Umbelopsis isabellina]
MVLFGWKGKKLLIAINAVAGLSIFFFGYDQGVMSDVNIAPDYLQIMGLESNPALLGGVVAVYYAGCLIGALMGGYIGDRIGRIRTVVVGSGIAVIGAALQCSAQNVAWMICARIITGIGTGHLNAIVPVWSAETSHHTSRGMFIAIEFTLNIFGVVVAYWLGYGMSYTEGGIRWRFPLGFQLIPLAVLMVIINFFPESPRWLLRMGRKEEALEILAALRGDGDPEHTEVQKEYNDIIEAIEIEHEGEMGYLEMFKKDPLNIARRVHLSVWLQIIQELTGIGVVTVYAPECFQKAGFSSQKSQLIAGINNITYMLSTLVAVFTLDRFGRRFSLFWGAAAQGISLILLSIMVHPAMLAKNPTAFGIAGTVFIFMYTAFFGMTWLTVPWLYPVEIYPLKVRAKGGAWSVVGWSVGNALVAEITPPLLAAWNNYTFLFFGLINIIAIPIVWALYPETANRTLEEMDIVFATDTPFVWKAEKELKQNRDAIVEKAKDAKGEAFKKRRSSVGVEPSNNVDPEKQNDNGWTANHQENA